MSSSAIWFWPGSHNYFLLWSRLQIQLDNIHFNILSKAGLVNIFFPLFLSWNFFPSNFSSIVIVLQGIIVWVDSCDLSVPVICLPNPLSLKFLSIGYQLIFWCLFLCVTWSSSLVAFIMHSLLNFFSCCIYNML